INDITECGGLEKVVVEKGSKEIVSNADQVQNETVNLTDNLELNNAQLVEVDIATSSLRRSPVLKKKSSFIRKPRERQLVSCDIMCVDSESKLELADRWFYGNPSGSRGGMLLCWSDQDNKNKKVVKKLAKKYHAYSLVCFYNFAYNFALFGIY
ncbi:calcium-dependent phospholipid-binding protein, partial [Striga asiatica]